MKLLSADRMPGKHLRERSAVYLDDEGSKTERMGGCKTGRGNEFCEDENSVQLSPRAHHFNHTFSAQTLRVFCSCSTTPSPKQHLPKKGKALISVKCPRGDDWQHTTVCFIDPPVDMVPDLADQSSELSIGLISNHQEISLGLALFEDAENQFV